MDTGSKIIQEACTDLLKNVSKNRRHYLKKEYFDKVQANEVSIKSPVKYLSDEEWQNLVNLWSSARHRVCLQNIELLVLCWMFIL
jgi:aspartate/glutamate racemase